MLRYAMLWLCTEGNNNEIPPPLTGSSPFHASMLHSRRRLADACRAMLWFCKEGTTSELPPERELPYSRFHVTFTTPEWRYDMLRGTDM